MWRLEPQIKAQNRKYRMHHVLRVPEGSEKGNVITHDRRLLKTTEAKRCYRMERKGPSISTYVFLPSPLARFRPKVSPQCGESEPHHFIKTYFSPATRHPAGGGENVNFNHPSLRWRHTPRCRREKNLTLRNKQQEEGMSDGCERLADLLCDPVSRPDHIKASRLVRRRNGNIRAPSRNRRVACIFLKH